MTPKSEAKGDLNVLHLLEGILAGQFLLKLENEKVIRLVKLGEVVDYNPAMSLRKGIDGVRKVVDYRVVNAYSKSYAT